MTSKREPATSPPRFRPLTASLWPDLEKLFGPRGACGGCWCMYWRLPRARFEAQKGAGNKRAFKRVVTGQAAPGILAYHEGEPVGWCAVGPRGDYSTLERSRVLRRVDETPVWAITCLFVARPLRRMGISVALLREAVRYARRKGAPAVEGYPVEPKTERFADAFAWTGLASAFGNAGFKEVARRSPTRPIMRIVFARPQRGRRPP